MTMLPRLRECLLDLGQPIAKRTHVAFHLRTMNTPDAVEVVAEALRIREDSELMRHELAYILGQMQNPVANSTLEAILDDETDDVLVRHESAEALGAIGDVKSIDILMKYCNHKAPEISETCKIAVDLIKWRKTKGNSENVDKGLYLSIDPAPPLSQDVSIDELVKIMMDKSASLFQRYRAMFSLRNLNSDDSALALLSGFDDDSVLFRHEVAYVLGQMQRSATVNGLLKVLENKDEHRMVRHEAAEALGAVGGNKVEDILAQYKDNDDIVVTQSCEVALDTMDYWSEFS